MSQLTNTATAVHAKGWISATNPRLHHSIEENAPGFWTDCWLCWLAALRDTPNGLRAVEQLAADSGRAGVVLEIAFSQPPTTEVLLKRFGHTVTALAGGGTHNGRDEGYRITVTAADATHPVQREVRDGTRVVMRDGHLTPEFLEWALKQYSDEDQARELAELRDMVENGGGLAFGDFFPKLLKELEGP